MPTREQERAKTAYNCIRTVLDLDSYKSAVNTFFTTILRSGLASAMSLLERKSHDVGFNEILSHLIPFGIPGYGNQSNNIPENVRRMEVGAYILATRQTLRAVYWLKRAAQAKSAMANPPVQRN